jgi:hypothetical protein
MAVILNGHSFKNFGALYAKDFYALQHLTTRKAESVTFFFCRTKRKVNPIHTMMAHKGVVQV